MRRFTLLALLMGVGMLLATWGEATPDRSEANVGTPTMQFRVESGASTCTPLPYPTECTVPGTGVFDLAVAVTNFPPAPGAPSTAGYVVAHAHYDWTGTSLMFEKRANVLEVPWPDRGNVYTINFVVSATSLQLGDLSTGAGSAPSTFKGDVIELRFHCSAGPSTNVVNLVPHDAATNPGGAQLVDSSAVIFPQSDSITINCASPDLDTDGDGCTDLREMGTNPMWGGLRNPNYFWDFYDTPNLGTNYRDKVITATGDILGVARRFGATDLMGMAAINRNSDPLAGPPPPFPEYHPAFDRSPAPMGADPWDMGPPDGTISVVVDLFGVVRQIGHNCLWTPP